MSTSAFDGQHYPDSIVDFHGDQALLDGELMQLHIREGIIHILPVGQQPTQLRHIEGWSCARCQPAGDE